ncbi:MAG: hypothetical protein GYA48_12790 [Chloroflexi bacterium]|nr:hypothetical protein [Chloroflexota bacterium]
MKTWIKVLGGLLAVGLVAAGGYSFSLYRDLRNPPEIDFWYDDAPLVFAGSGLAQNQINVLGNVRDPNGVASLYYRLNEGVETFLSVGPDLRRLENPGDFNIDLMADQLKVGENSLTLYAWDGAGNKAEKVLEFDYQPQEAMMPLELTWNQVKNIPQVAMIVDGEWQLTPEGLSNIASGYDRLIAVGDRKWQDYDVSMQFRLDDIDPSGWEYPSGSPAVGVILRWQGHSDYPKAGWQPQSGWLPMGAITWIRWDDDKQGAEIQIMEGVEGTVVAREEFAPEPKTGDWYLLHAQVETDASGDSWYRISIWPDGENEPADWMLESQFPSLAKGSVVILAHEVKVTVEKIFVYPLTPQ